MFYGILGVVLAILLYLVILSVLSRTAPEVGLADGVLLPCPDSSNCVSSLDTDKGAYIEPLVFEGSPDAAWLAVKDAIQKHGGRIEKENNNYMWTTFRTRIFRFVDDVEVLKDSEMNKIYFRSASRVGRSDMGANRKRVERIRDSFNKLQEQ